MLVLHANWTAGALRLWGEARDGGVVAGASHADAEALTDADAHSSATAVAVVDAPSAPPHPFVMSAADLARTLVADGRLEAAQVDVDGSGELQARLPMIEGRPLPSNALVDVLDETPELGTFTVPCLTLAGDHAITALLGLESLGPSANVTYGHSLRYWMVVARFVLELLADQRFVPTLIRARGRDLRAAWQPWIHDDSARARVGTLLACMPPVARCVVDDHEGQPWPILDEAMSVLTDANVRHPLITDDFNDSLEDRDASDPHVAWLAGLLGLADDVTAPADPSELIRDVGLWLSELDDSGQDRPLRLCLRLDEPPEDDVAGQDLAADPGKAVWRLGLLLVGTGADAVMIEAEQVWSDPGAVQRAGGGSQRADEVLLAELGRAARVYPPIEAALSDAAPCGIDLTTREAFAFLTEFREILEESGFDVIVPEWWGRTSHRLGMRLVLDAPAPAAPDDGGHGTATANQPLLGLAGLVNYRWQVAVGDRPLSIDEFNRLAKMAADGSLVRLDGAWIELKPEEVAEAAALLESEPTGEMTLLEAIRLGHGAASERPVLPILGLDADGWVADLLGASVGEGGMPTIPQPENFIGDLRPYQVVGLSWLLFLDRLGFGACLADDMGLGKTIQLIALLQAERQNGTDTHSVGPTLLIVPTSVVSNWGRELSRFAPEIRVHVHHGPDRPTGDQFVRLVEDIDVVITTYTLVSRDRETLTRVDWYRVVLDEAQYIKNPPTKQTATIQALRTARRVALTGTPVENRLSELWSIMEFCNPGYLGQPGEFRRRFSVPIERHRDPQRAEQLRRLVRPFILRRLKTDPTVISDLPPCVITKEYATLSAEQAALYERTVSTMLGQVGRAEGIQRRGLVLATLVKLKQICNHPAQLEEIASNGRIDASGDVGYFAKRSGKAKRMSEMLEEVLATGDKALVFTQFRKMGHLLSAMVRHELDSDVMFLHGGTPPAKRQQMIDRFQDPDGGIPIFVLSLKAGGIGVNLTAANHVFHFDRWWNPAVENQATDRAFRIGQTRTVHVHKFVCLGTLEERIDQMIEQKTELAANIIGAGEAWLADLSTGELRELLALRESAMEAEV